MARIRAIRSGGVTRVLVSGRLSSADMGRLEHACAPALTSEAIPLELDLRRMTDADRTAQALIDRMVTRGARVSGR
jgi:hypothetical protein